MSDEPKSMPRNCPACGGLAPLLFAARDRNRHISTELFAYHRCSSCDLIFLGATPSGLADYYPKDYYEIPPGRQALAAGAEAERYKIDMVRQFVRQGRLLEIGPAVGGFAYLAKEAGFEVEVIEMDARCCRFLSDEVGVRAINSRDEIASLDSVEPVNIIALWHVIEHLQDPWRMLDVAVNKLLPGGMLVIASPNPSALQFRMLGRLWTHLDAPRHLHLIPERVLVQRAEAQGMTVVLRTTTDAGSLGWNRFGWEYSLAGLTVGSFRRKLARAAGRAVARLLAPLERIDGMGSAYTVVLRKGSP